MLSALQAAAKSVAGDAVAGSLDAPELLGVDVKLVARCLAFVANDRLDGIEIAQRGQGHATELALSQVVGREEAARSGFAVSGIGEKWIHL